MAGQYYKNVCGYTRGKLVRKTRDVKKNSFENICICVSSIFLFFHFLFVYQRTSTLPPLSFCSGFSFFLFCLPLPFAFLMLFILRPLSFVRSLTILSSSCSPPSRTGKHTNARGNISPQRKRELPVMLVSQPH